MKDLAEYEMQVAMDEIHADLTRRGRSGSRFHASNRVCQTKQQEIEKMKKLTCGIFWGLFIGSFWIAAAIIRGGAIW